MKCVFHMDSHGWQTIREHAEFDKQHLFCGFEKTFEQSVDGKNKQNFSL